VLGGTAMHDRISIHAICFPNANLETLMQRLREVQAHRVTLIGSMLLQEGVPAIQQALATGPFQVETVVHPMLPGKHLDAPEASWAEARAALRRVIEAAHAVGARSIQLMTGGHGSLTWEVAADRFRELLAPCAAQARAAGVPLIVENASALFADVNITHTLRDTVELGERADVGVCLEFFGCWNEAGLHETIRRAVPRCHLVQVCDYVYGDRSLPARAVPGDGAIPVKRMIEWILQAGYQGSFDLELIGPRIDREGHVASVRRAAENVGAILRSLGV
jgi:sugar phosphate isomerase/epimerase